MRQSIMYFWGGSCSNSTAQRIFVAGAERIFMRIAIISWYVTSSTPIIVNRLPLLHKQVFRLWTFQEQTEKKKKKILPVAKWKSQDPLRGEASEGSYTQSYFSLFRLRRNDSESWGNTGQEKGSGWGWLQSGFHGIKGRFWWGLDLTVPSPSPWPWLCLCLCPCLPLSAVIDAVASDFFPSLVLSF